ncbi:MAG: nitroreductase family protein, partial [Actinomycetota bacterium]|nr:nitroreductase family protein [Actinomycetota bacterium]
MEFADLVRRRRMTRSFLDRPVEPEVLDRVLEAARRVPSAGNSQGFDFVLLEGPSETALYWDATMPAERRTSFRWQSLLGAPVIVTVWADPGRYVERYAEQDKERTGLGEGAEAWTTPYWLVDASFAAMALQYAAIDEGLGVLFFGMFDHAAAV